MDIARIIDEAFDASMETMRNTKHRVSLERVARILCEALRGGHTIFFCGNGGSAEQAQHFVGELVGRYKRERPGLAALALGTNTPLLTAWANDYDFESVFARELEALGHRGDVLVGLSTSGNSRNVVRAVERAKQMGITTIGMLGEGGALQTLVDIPLAVASRDTPRIQETHLLLIHTISHIVEALMFD